MLELLLEHPVPLNELFKRRNLRCELSRGMVVPIGRHRARGLGPFGLWSLRRLGLHFERNKSFERFIEESRRRKVSVSSAGALRMSVRGGR
jgi:hypothetical protein